MSERSDELLNAANDYIRRGLRVIALTGKTPNGSVHRHWDQDYLSEANTSQVVEAAFAHPQTTGIGILTGGPYFVVDIDGEAGAQAWLDIVGEADLIPTRWVAQTARGYHMWFADWVPRRSRKLGEKLDLKADGGYVASPPSWHPGDSEAGIEPGFHYAWKREPDDEPPLQAPAALVALLDKQDRQTESQIVGRAQRKRVRHASREDGKWWATWGFEGILKTVREMRSGERNSTLYWAAFTMTEDGAEDEDFDQLREAAAAAGLAGREIRLTIRSARRAATGG